MAVSIQGGLVLINGRDLSAYLDTYQAHSLTQNLTEDTTIADLSKTYTPTLAEGTAAMEGFFDSSTDATHEVFNNALDGTNDIICVLPEDGTFENEGVAFKTHESSYGIEGVHDGVVRVTTEFSIDGDDDRIISLHDLAAETSSGTGSTNNHGSSTSAGGSAYLQLTEFTGTSIDVEIRHSNDDFVSDDTQLAAFTQVTADDAAERITFTGTVKQYVRAKWTINGSSPSMTFFVGFHRA